MALREQIDQRERAMSLGYSRPSDDPEKRRCRWCGGAVPKGRRSWCSEGCVHEALLRAQPGYARRKVLERDHGVCSSCGLDCARLERLVERLARVAHGHLYRTPDGTLERRWCGRGEVVPHPAAAKRQQDLEIAFAILGLWAGHDLRKPGEWVGHIRKVTLKHSLWQADHIKPVVEGGGGCGLDNLRTLCLRCHKNATAELATKRAKAKQLQQGLSLDGID